MALPVDYASKSAAEKLELLWREIGSDPYPDNDLPTQPPSGGQRRKLFSVAFTRKSFDHRSDEMPAERIKLVHRYGTTAKVTVNVDDAQGFTGVFATGGPAILRFSDAAGGGKTPSLAMKFMVDDGKPSLNFLALPYRRRDPDDRDPLNGVYANATHPPEAFDVKAVAFAFQRTADALGGKRLYAVYLPLHHMAGTNLDGSTVAEPVVPDRIELHGTQATRDLMKDHRDWRRSLASLPAGTVLFDLAISTGIDDPAKPLGTVTLDAPFVASRYGDERLFFQHDTGPT